MAAKKSTAAKLAEVKSVAAKNRAAAKKLEILKQKTILSFAENSRESGLHSSLVIAPNNVVQLLNAKKPAQKMNSGGKASDPRLSSFRYQFGVMNPRFQQSSRYMAQVASAKREHMNDVERLLAESKKLKETDAEISKFLTIGDMDRVKALQKYREKTVKEIRLKHAKAQKTKRKVEEATAKVMTVAGMGNLPVGMGGESDTLPAVLLSQFTGLLSDIGINLGQTVQAGVTGVIQAHTAAEIAKANMKAQAALLRLQQEAQARIAAQNPPTVTQQVTTAVQNSLQKPWYQNPMYLLPAAGVLGLILWKK